MVATRATPGLRVQLKGYSPSTERLQEFTDPSGPDDTNRHVIRYVETKAGFVEVRCDYSDLPMTKDDRLQISIYDNGKEQPYKVMLRPETGSEKYLLGEWRTDWSQGVIKVKLHDLNKNQKLAVHEFRYRNKVVLQQEGILRRSIDLPHPPASAP